MGLTTTLEKIFLDSNLYPFPQTALVSYPGSSQLLKLISDYVQKHGFSPIVFLLATVQDKLLQDLPLWPEDCLELKTMLVVGSRETSDPPLTTQKKLNLGPCPKLAIIRDDFFGPL